MITPAQYWISGGKVGGGFGRSYSCELGRNVKRSTNENTFVWRGVEAAGVARVDCAVGLAFSFPLLLAKALKKPVLDVAATASLKRDDGPAFGVAGCCGLSVAVAGWKLVRGW
jgi:hypothetical protein